MKVLFVFSTGKMGGGAAEVWLTLLDTLPARGVEPYVVIPQDEDRSMTEQLNRRNIPWTEAFFTWWVTSDKDPHSFRHKMRRAAAKVVNRAADKVIGNYIEKNGIELVYICDGTITAGLHAAQRRGIPVVWHIQQYIHRNPDAEHKGGVTYIDPAAHVGSTLAKADAIIAVSRSIKTHLRGRFPMCRKVEHIYNAIPAHRVGNNPDVLTGERVVFTLAGRFEANKGQDDALAAFLQVAPDFPEAFLSFVGEPDDEIAPALWKQASESPVAYQVEFRGFVEDMPSVWKRTDVALNCSYSEGCSIVVGEAMSSGCLVLCSTAEGNVEMVSSRHGLLYERRKPDALAAEMRWVLEHREEARRIAAEGKRFARRAFNVERQADEVYRVLTEVLS